MANIELSNVSVDYPIYDGAGRSLRTALMHGVGGAIGAKRGRVIIEALRDINLTVRKGDRIGLVGHNGAGKSTLLRVMGGIYEPPVGTVRIEGRVSCLFDLMTGMDLEATGYENILLRGVTLGLSMAQARALAPQIEAFSELGEYLALPVRTYSAGMQLRLGFAITTAVPHDIVLMDEFIAVGDATFRKKAEERLYGIVDHAGILVISSHVPKTIRLFCNKVIRLHEGRIAEIGETTEDIERIVGA
jgi:ABC-2 type transport system ATP-binding protein/lipopolysaccharide transport system ATP-binding protein